MQARRRLRRDRHGGGGGARRRRCFDDLIGARPDPASPSGATTQTLAAGDRVHPSTRDLPLELNRTDVWYRWQTRPTGTVHTVARWHALRRAGRRRHDRRRAPTIRSPGAGTSAAAGPSTPAWAGPRAATPSSPSATHLLGAIQWAAGLVRGNCKATINANYRGTRVVGGGPVDDRPGHERRVARAGRSRRTAGCSTSAAATAAPTPSAARWSASRRCRGSSTTPTRTWGSAAAACTSGIPRSTTGRSTAA